ncbi:MAG TPA: vanadium-dependent haloperoxidase [Chryseosolibacter sp.]|nr:vanadium-dependent haloperoxidase [Chryseosolibacter sp.]
MKNFTSGLFLLLVCFSCAVTPESKTTFAVEETDVLHGSVKQVTDVIVHDIFSPPVAARIYAYMSIAAYETAIQGDQTYRSLAGQLNGFELVPVPDPGLEHDFELASIHALLKVGKALVFSEEKIEVFYDSIIKQYRQSGISEETFDRSIAYGTKVADHVLAWAAKDNYKQTRSFPKYTIENNAATWKPTPPAYMDAVEPHWNKIRTFGIDSAGQFKPVPPTPFSSEKKSQFFKEALEVYQMTKDLTPEQKEIASFWDCNPFMLNVKGHVMFATKKISPGGHWMNITNVACKKAKADFRKASEAYMRVSVALVDGFISCWDEKYRSRLIRPESFINQYVDQDWVPLLQTPPFPEYTSGHSVISSASAVTLTKLFGENFAFTDSTEIEFGLTARSFNSFEQAAEEAAMSRMYGGIHYRPAVVNGMTEGRALGSYLMEKIKTRKEESLANN